MEDWTKVLLYGTFEGFSWSTDGDDNILLVLENGDKLEIPNHFVKNASDFVEKNKIKLKDVIKRIEVLNLGTQKVWLDEILNELGSDYGTLKYKDGYEQGKFEASMIPYEESQKVTIPQFVADWIKYCKRHNFTLFGCLDPVDNFEVLVGEGFEGEARKCIAWCRSASDKVARAWLDGYTVEVKRYRVNVKNVRTRQGTLNRSKKSGVFIFSNPEENNLYGTKFTRKELEDAGFGEVFNSPLFEVEEVE